jgi:imidazolonepropionase-like amidohydrolase
MKRRLLIRDACLADGHAPSLQVGISLLIENGRIAWVSPDESDPRDADVLDGGGATIVPAFVDAHSHLTMPGGSHWIDRGSDPPDQLREVARRNAARLVQSGVLWARDVGSPAGPDGHALSLDVREEMTGRVQAPYIRVAGTWIATEGYLPMTVAVKDGDGLAAAAVAQLDSGTDFVKIMLDPPGRADDRCPFTVDDVRKACEAVHRRGRKITAHATILDGARVGAEAGVDSIEHGMELDDVIAATMRANNVALVSTLSVLASWATFERTTRIARFTGEEGKRRLEARREGAFAAIKAARRAGVRIAAGSDFGGGSVRAGHLAWEVERLVAAGLEPVEALAAVSWRGGELLGIDHAGRIRPGDPADLVLVHGDPLSDPSALWRVWAVFKAGERVV